MDSETDGHGEVITVTLHCGKSVVKLTICGDVSIKPCSVSALPHRSNWQWHHIMFNRSMLTLYCLIGHSTVISRRPTMWVTATGSQHATLLTHRFWNRNLGRIVPPRRL